LTFRAQFSLVGVNVKSFSIGDKVFAHAPKAYATLCAVKANELAKVPDGMDLASAAALPTVTTTGAQLADLALGNSKDTTYWFWEQSEMLVVPLCTA
jgi:NADPH:quinone reductase-like Zn-dependent oxidoreductase